MKAFCWLESLLPTRISIKVNRCSNAKFANMHFMDGAGQKKMAHTLCTPNSFQIRRSTILYCAYYYFSCCRKSVISFSVHIMPGKIKLAHNFCWSRLPNVRSRRCMLLEIRVENDDLRQQSVFIRWTQQHPQLLKRWISASYSYSQVIVFSKNGKMSLKQKLNIFNSV